MISSSASCCKSLRICILTEEVALSLTWAIVVPVRTSAGNTSLEIGRVLRFSRTAGRQHQSKGRTSIGVALVGDLSSMRFDDLLNDGQTEPRPACLTGMKWLEHIHPIRNAYPSIVYLQAYIVRGSSCPHGQGASPRHRLSRVRAEVK